MYRQFSTNLRHRFDSHVVPETVNIITVTGASNNGTEQNSVGFFYYNANLTFTENAEPKFTFLVSISAIAHSTDEANFIRNTKFKISGKSKRLFGLVEKINSILDQKETYLINSRDVKKVGNYFEVNEGLYSALLNFFTSDGALTYGKMAPLTELFTNEANELFF